MLLRKGEVHSRLKDNDNISFSKEVAETLGIESAIILEFCKSKRINFSNNINDLVFLIKKEFSPLLHHHPQINNIIELDKSKGWKGLVNLGNQLKHSDYDQVFDIHNVFRSKILSFFLKKQTFLQIKKPRLKRFMLFNLKLNFLRNKKI